jgi:hypothetical protein
MRGIVIVDPFIHRARPVKQLVPAPGTSLKVMR